MLPKDAKERAESFTKLPAERKDEILGHVAATPKDRQRATINAILATGGAEAELIRHVLGKEVADPAAAPKNKKVNPPQTK